MNYLIPILFYSFAIALLFSAIKVVTVKNPVKASLWLVLTFAISSLQWILMQAEFLGIVLLLVYVGAVMVLFLFVVMMLNIDGETMRAGFWKNLPISFTIGILVAASLILIFISPDTDLASFDHFKNLSIDYNSVREIGKVLYSKSYVIAFELAAVMLLLGMVSAIALVNRESKNSKRVQPKDQVKVNPYVGRVEIVKMKPVVMENKQELSKISGTDDERGT
ncbi:MAG: NADH-quinone oxidoreductase subunit J [Neisseriaceae bacterium]|nr:MAG: NADH-quinone oxidoreductase subunit J [Neisseriaceae bacterium]